MSNVANIQNSFLAASQDFENAWANPKYTRFELPAPDVNKVLSECYDLGKPVSLTGSMVWDMELKKGMKNKTKTREQKIAERVAYNTQQQAVN